MNNFAKLIYTSFLAALLVSFPSHAISYDLMLPDTGQNLCYEWEGIMCDEWHKEGFYQICDSPPYCPSEGEDFFGQDGTYTINPPDLTDNGDGTIADNLTGLTWEQKSEVNETYSYSYADAISYCDDLILGGSTDWRVPTRKEYSTILNYGNWSPSLDEEYFPYYTTGSTNGEMLYWTTSEYHDDSTQVWYIQMPFSLIDKTPKTGGEPQKVRCVQGDTEPAASYTDNGDSTVTDNVTGLIWEQKTDDDGTRDKDITYTWKDALAYCESLVLATTDDWRLPNPKELERIVDLGSSSPAIDTTYFPNTNYTVNPPLPPPAIVKNDGLYWTGTTCSGCHRMKAFAIDFEDGELYYGNKFREDVYDENYVRCVRHPDPDDDGYSYPNDNCPYISNPGQENVGDTDDVGDACDNCPNINNTGQEDADDDTLGDVCDNCPTDSNLDQEDNYPPQGNDIGDACDCEGDFNCSGGVDATDVTTFLLDFGRSPFSNPCPDVPKCKGDFNCDFNVDAADVTVFLEDFGRSVFSNPCPACVQGNWCTY